MNDLISGRNKSGRNVFVDFCFSVTCLAPICFSLRHEKDNRINILRNITGILEIQAKFALGDHVLKACFSLNNVWLKFTMGYFSKKADPFQNINKN